MLPGDSVRSGTAFSSAKSPFSQSLLQRLLRRRVVCPAPVLPRYIANGIPRQRRTATTRAFRRLPGFLALQRPRQLPRLRGLPFSSTDCSAFEFSGPFPKYRVDDAPVIDASAPAPEPCQNLPDLGYSKDLDAHYHIEGTLLGKGGNGTVHVATRRDTGVRYACKRIPKQLEVGLTVSERKRSTHLDSIKREVEVLQKLRGCLNVVELHDVFEDAEYVYIIMENCQGGELSDRIQTRHYSERTVASYMRAVLRTLAVMHSHRILHRDVKPGNFMLLNTSDRSPLKAIDFGLAMPYDPEELPRADLGLEGTPWYMAPEVLSAQVGPASDVWSAGVMAHQLLTGRMPFDDKRHPSNPAITAIWKSVLTDSVDFSRPYWAKISPEGRDFVSLLLERDPAKRLTAKQALEHPWLQGTSRERSMGKRLHRSVVQRIQRFAQGGIFKRTVLQSIAAEILDTASPPPAASLPPSPSGAPAVSQPLLKDPRSPLLTTLYEALAHGPQEDGLGGGSMNLEQLGNKLRAMGFKIEDTEMSRLLDLVDLRGSGQVDRATFAASQMDWRAVQGQNQKEWLELAEKAFRTFDVNEDGVLDTSDLAAALSTTVAAHDLPKAVQQVLAEAHGSRPACTSSPFTSLPPLSDPSTSAAAAANSIDFQQFLTLLRQGSLDSLDQYDGRFSEADGSRDGSSRSRGSYLSNLSMHAGDRSNHLSSLDQLNRMLQASGADDGRSGDLVSVDGQQGGPSVAAEGFFRFDLPSKAAAGPLQHTTVAAGPGAASRDGRHKTSTSAPPRPDVAVHGGSHFDSRHHGSSLYLNQVMPRRAGGA